MKSPIISILLSINYLFIYSFDTPAANSSNHAVWENGTIAVLSPNSHEYRKQLASRMTLDQLMELKDKLVKLTENYPKETSEEYSLLYDSSSILAIGLYLKDKKHAMETLNETKNNTLLCYKKRGDKKWDRDDREDQRFYRKFTLYHNLLSEFIFTSTIEKDFGYALNLVTSQRR